MKTTFALLSLLVLGAAHGAETPADGLYRVAPGAPAPQIRSQDGTMLFLGERRELQVQNVRLRSNGNANDSFDLRIEIPYDQMLDPDPYILIAGGTAYHRAYSGCGDRSCWLQFRIQQDSNARQVAGYLGVSITYFRHPGHRLLTSFTPAKPSFARGDEVTALFRIVNVGTEPVTFEDDLRQCPMLRFDAYSFSAFKGNQPVPDIGIRPPNAYCVVTVLVPDVVLQPGAAFEDTVSLSKWFGFKEPGAYRIRGSLPLQFRQSNVRLSIDTFSPIWVDYVTAEFTVTIED